MKALVYRGSRDVRVEKVLDPKIEKPTDVLVKITSTKVERARRARRTRRPRVKDRILRT